jgi:hypothetical protein
MPNQRKAKYAAICKGYRVRAATAKEKLAQRQKYSAVPRQHKACVSHSACLQVVNTEHAFTMVFS